MAYIARRLLWAPFLLLAVSFITFSLGRFGPGDPAQVIMGQYQNPETQARLRDQMGLNRPIYIQYGMFLRDAVKLNIPAFTDSAKTNLFKWPPSSPNFCALVSDNFGESYRFRGRNVGELICGRIWISMQLGIAASAIALVIGIPLGFIAALKQGTWLDVAIVSITLFFMSLPVFITAPFLLIFFVLWTGLLPSHGWNGFFSTNIIMPALILGVPGIAAITRLTRASTLEVIGQEYVRTARSKGLKELVINRRHILRNALIPIFTVVGLSLGTLVEGSFITEGYFGIPGIGRLAIESFFSRDYPVITALGLVIATSFVIVNLAVDIGYRLIDPRIRY